jgi:high-affinity iron transporter
LKKIIIIDENNNHLFHYTLFLKEVTLMRRGISLILFTLIFSIMIPFLANAQSSAIDNLKKAEKSVDQALQFAKQGQLDKAKESYQQFNDTWMKIESGVKDESSDAYRDIESKMGEVVYAFAQSKSSEVTTALEGLQNVNNKFIRGEFPKGEKFKQKNVSLGDFILMLQQTKEDAQKQDQAKALASIANARESWLSVEGVVVAQSAQVYSDSERDLVTINAMLSTNPPNYNGAIQTVDSMTKYLSPLASKTTYTMWDAAMILVREGLEALLVIAALLAFVRKSNSNKGKSWVWIGVAGGMAVSIILAVIVKLVFSSGAFGNNNSLIAGWTGIFAAAMLLYMSYWLHSQSSIKDWQKFLRSKSETAINTGKLISIGLLSFLAVFREGTETVLFYIGMVNQIAMKDLLLGLLIGLALLLVIAYLMIIVGVKLPIRLFFMVSSAIVFYLCIKFTGMGIHSLQLAGTLPSNTAAVIPNIDFLALYPSWESTIPQIALILIALWVVVWKKVNKKHPANQAT